MPEPDAPQPDRMSLEEVCIQFASYVHFLFVGLSESGRFTFGC